MNKVKKIGDKMPDVFYAMRREAHEEVLRQRLNKSKEQKPDINNKNTTKQEEYFSTDSTESDRLENEKEIARRKKLLEQSKLTTKQKFWKRFVSTWIIIFTFFLIVWIGHTALCILVAVFQVFYMLYIERKFAL